MFSLSHKVYFILSHSSVILLLYAYIYIGYNIYCVKTSNTQFFVINIYSQYNTHPAIEISTISIGADFSKS